MINAKEHYKNYHRQTKEGSLTLARKGFNQAS